MHSSHCRLLKKCAALKGHAYTNQCRTSQQHGFIVCFSICKVKPQNPQFGKEVVVKGVVKRFGKCTDQMVN